jgi:exopolysaccharide biosynthesis polyprenyl glycosylphosphotransferase
MIFKIWGHDTNFWRNWVMSPDFPACAGMTIWLNSKVLMLFKHIPKKKVLLLAGDVVLISLAYLLTPMLRFGIFLFAPFQSIGEWLIILLIYLLSFYTAELYSLEVKFLQAQFVFRFSIAMFAATVVVLTASVFFPLIVAGHGGLPLINAGLICLFTYGWRLVFERLFQQYLKREIRTVIVGAGRAGKKTYQLIRNHPDIQVIGFVDDDSRVKSGDTVPISGEIGSCPQIFPQVLGNLSVLDDIVKRRQADLIIIAIKHLTNREIVKRSMEYILQGTQVLSLPAFYEEALRKIPVDHLTDQWFINAPFQGVKPTIYNLRVKRLIDVALSVSGLILSMPIVVIAGSCIRLDSKGPVFYRQARVGWKGKTFELIKLRTMKTGADLESPPPNGESDPRVTRVGRVIRKLRIDEFPQFWTVLKGEMSLVGPRALIEKEVTLFEKEVPYFALRHAVKPGITGWAQINYPHGDSIEDALEKVQYDLFYIKNLSFFLDFHVVLRTIRVVFLGKGAK